MCLSQKNEESTFQIRPNYRNPILMFKQKRN